MQEGSIERGIMASYKDIRKLPSYDMTIDRKTTPFTIIGINAYGEKVQGIIETDKIAEAINDNIDFLFGDEM